MSQRSTPLVCIGGHRKSGTALFHSLLDGHPDLSVYPFDLRILEHYYPMYTDVDFTAGERKNRLNQVVFQHIREQLASVNMHRSLPLPLFEEIFYTKCNSGDLGDPAAVIDNLLQSYAQVQHRPKPAWHVCKERSSEIYANEILTWFPRAKFIHLIRDPRDNFAALHDELTEENRYSEKDKEALAILLTRAKLGMQLAKENQRRFGEERYLILRFEDLVNHTEETMSRVTNFLQIPYSPSMLHSTFMGQNAMNPEMGVLQVKDLGRRKVNQWQQRISPEEAQIIEFHFKDVMHNYAYQPNFSEEQQSQAASRFYKWMNYRYFQQQENRSVPLHMLLHTERDGAAH